MNQYSHHGTSVPWSDGGKAFLEHVQALHRNGDSSIGNYDQLIQMGRTFRAMIHEEPMDLGIRDRLMEENARHRVRNGRMPHEE